MGSGSHSLVAPHLTQNQSQSPYHICTALCDLILVVSLSSSPSHSAIAILTYLLFIKHVKDMSTPGPLHWLFHHPVMLIPPDLCMTHSLASFRSLLKCHHPDHPL